MRERVHEDTVEEREPNKDTPGPENGPGKTKKAATKEKLEVRERDNEDNLTVRERSKDNYNPKNEDKHADTPGRTEHCNIIGQDEQAEQWSNYQDGSTSQTTHNTTQCPTKIGPVARYVNCPVITKHDHELTSVHMQGTDGQAEQQYTNTPGMKEGHQALNKPKWKNTPLPETLRPSQ